jgi:hypothetical protein
MLIQGTTALITGANRGNGRSPVSTPPQRGAATIGRGASRIRHQRPDLIAVIRFPGSIRCFLASADDHALVEDRSRAFERTSGPTSQPI